MANSSQHKTQIIANIATVISVIALGGFLFWCWQQGILTSQEKMNAFISGFGGSAEIMFLLVQIAQIIFPFVPGGISCIAGVVLFGAWKGFFLNYFGICTGSIIVFCLSKRYGPPLMHKLFKEETIRKYQGWTEKNKRFTKLFTIAVVFPFFPDDFLCYLAGTTSMKLKTFTVILLLGKPISLAAYSVSFDWIIQALSHL